jgi:hypothetical protein
MQNTPPLLSRQDARENRVPELKACRIIEQEACHLYH